MDNNLTTDGEFMTTYGYVRVSTLVQAKEGDSLEAQKRQIISYASSKGYFLEEHNIFIEKGVSGGVGFEERPEGFKLYELMTKGDILIFPKLDRAFRNTRNALNVLYDLKEKNVSVHFIDLGGDVTGNGIGAIIFTILSAFATFEKERIGTRIREVKQMKKLEGKFVGGRKPFGFKIVDGIKQIKEEDQVIIKTMRKMRANGSSYRKLSEWSGKESSRKLSHVAIRALLQRT
jgi:DNA invertase Pin-like site-specific DNA recombinase